MEPSWLVILVALVAFSEEVEEVSPVLGGLDGVTSPALAGKARSFRSRIS